MGVVGSYTPASCSFCKGFYHMTSHMSREERPGEDGCGTTGDRNRSEGSNPTNRDMLGGKMLGWW